jgi:nitrogen fixation protein FixH
MPQRDGTGARPVRNPWLYFPWFVAAAMGMVIAVNCFMAYSALQTFPGNAGSDGFDLSNRYNAIIERVRQQAETGWTVQGTADGAGHPVLMLTDRSAAPLSGAAIAATAQRPLGDRHMTQMRFTEVFPGQYRGDVALDEKGQWELQIRVIAGGQEFSTTRRVIVK